MSEDSDSNSSYYSVFLGSGEKCRQRLFSPQTSTHIYFPWNELYYRCFMLTTFAYCLIINLTLILCLCYSSFGNELNDDIKLKVLIWSTLQIFLTIIYQPIVFDHIITPFENFQSHVNIFYIVQLFITVINIVFLTCYIDILNVFLLWSSINVFSIFGYIINKCCQERIQSFTGY